MKLRRFILLIGLMLLVGSVYFLQSRQELDPAGLDRNTTNLIYSKHARCRMDCRNISEGEVIEILRKGIINYRKSNPNHRPDPTYALEGSTYDGQKVRIVFAVARTGMVVVTVIDLEKEYTCHCN